MVFSLISNLFYYFFQVVVAFLKIIIDNVLKFLFDSFSETRHFLRCIDTNQQESSLVRGDRILMVPDRTPVLELLESPPNEEVDIHNLLYPYGVGI